MLQRRADWLAALFCIVFLIVGSLWIGEVGLQNDEVLFAAGIYPPLGESVSIFKTPFPMMVMTYVGTVKSLLYTLIFKIWEPSTASVRIPAVVLGAVTVWLFYILVKRSAGAKAALVATALLATDTTFLLTTRWDWGPVATQHFCLVLGILAGISFHKTGRLVWLFAGSFLFGIGIWDKALFLWSLVGVGVAVVSVFPRRLWEAVRWKTLVVAAAGFLLGALPFIRYNVRNNWITFGQNTAWSLDQFAEEKQALRSTLDGSALFGTIVRENWEQPLRTPDDSAKAALLQLSTWLGEPRKNWQLPLFGLAVVLLPFVWRSRARTAFLFAFVFSAVTWAQMVVTKDAGGSAHHAVLLWPIPHLGVAAVLAEAANRAGKAGWRALGLIVGLVCLSNLAVIATYYAYMHRNGSVVAWTDAIHPAVEALPAMRPSYVCVLDWGFYEPIRLLHKGKIEPCWMSDPVKFPREFRDTIEIPNAVWITHKTGVEFDTGINERFLSAAQANGYAPSDQRVFYDRNGRPIIEVFKLFRTQRPLSSTHP